MTRINKVLPHADREDHNVLNYIRKQLTPSGLDARTEGHEDVTHLYEVAERRLRPYEKEDSHAE